MLAQARRAAIHDRHASNQHAAPLKPGQWCLSIILLFFFFKVGVGHFMGIMRALSPQLGDPPGILGKFSHGAHQETGPFLEKYHSEARWFMGGPPSHSRRDLDFSPRPSLSVSSATAWGLPWIPAQGTIWHCLSTLHCL